MSSKRLIVYASDAYQLSSLLLRNVLFAKRPPATTSSRRAVYGYYRDKTWQLLLDLSRRPSQPERIQSSSSSSSSPPAAAAAASSLSSTMEANIVAVKLLQLHREINLMKYHGMSNYIRQWWSSSSTNTQTSNLHNSSVGNNDTYDKSSSSSLSKNLNNNPAVEVVVAASKKNEKSVVARVPFMITSDMRHQLSTKLGYSTQDIRSLTPREAMMLLEHGVMKEGSNATSFRDRLNDLMMEKELEEVEEQTRIVSIHEQTTSAELDSTTQNTYHYYTLTPEDAHTMNVKPDVAMALLSSANIDMHVDGRLNGQQLVFVGGEDIASSIDKSITSIDTKQELDLVVDYENNTNLLTTTTTTTSTTTATTIDTSLHPITTRIDVTPRVSEDLGMKPDVAAAILTPYHQYQEQYELEPNNHGAVETRRRLTTIGEEKRDGSQCYWYEVMERYPTNYHSTTPTTTTTTTATDGTTEKHEHERSSNSNSSCEGQVIALFSTEKEALDCARLKQSLRALRSSKGGGEPKEEDRNNNYVQYLVRRRSDY